MVDVGNRIRTRRKALGLTLAELSKRSGVSRAMISDIELGHKNPTIRVAYGIALALDTNIAALLDAPDPGAISTIVKAEDRQILVDPSSGVERHLLAPAMVAKGVHLLMYRIPPGAAIDDLPPEPPGVCKHVTVLSGRVEGRVGGHRVTLEPGDSITFSADTSHGGTNVSDVPAEILILVHDARNAHQ